MSRISTMIVMASLLGSSLGMSEVLLPSSAFAVSAPVEGFSELNKRVSPSVVNISVTGTVKSESSEDDPIEQLNRERLEEFYLQQFPPEIRPKIKKRLREQRSPSEQKMASAGSGFIIDPSGIIVTNEHVIRDGDDIRVILKDGTKLKAKLIGKDSKSDIAVLKVNAPKPLPAVAFGDSEKAEEGDWVIAIGNPFGLGGSVTAGIISARHRNISTNAYNDFIQTDASINFGNSGSPLFNMQGEVIGVNSAIISTSGGSVGTNFAISSNVAQNVVAQLQKTGQVQRGWLGVSIQPVTPDIAESLGLEKADSALIAGVSPNSPAAKAGLEKGDIILSVNGSDITVARSLPRLIATLPADTDATLKILRKGQEITKTVKIGRMKDDKDDEDQNGSFDHSVKQGETEIENLGFSVKRIDEVSRQRHGLSDENKGLVVTRLDKKSIATIAGLKAGDLILEAQQMPVDSVETFQKIIEETQKRGRKSVLLGIIHNGSPFYLTLPFQDDKEK
jgi:serine protease Do